MIAGDAFVLPMAVLERSSDDRLTIRLSDLGEFCGTDSGHS